MENTATPTLEQVLEQGHALLAASRERRAQEAERLAAEQKQRYIDAWVEPVRAVEERWPFLAGLVECPEMEDPAHHHFESQLPNGYATVRVVVPGLEPVEVSLRDYQSGRGWELEEPALKLYEVYEDWSESGNVRYVRADKKNGIQVKSSELPVALAGAAEIHAERVRLQAQIDDEHQKWLKRREARATQSQAAPSDAERALALVRQLVALASPPAEEA